MHHISAGTMCPAGARWLTGRTGGRLVCHCLLIETADGLVLVDTGIGLGDIAEPKRRLGSGFCRAARPSLDPEDTAAGRVQQLGFAVDDVRHIIPTHMDPDHAGGLSDFPKAKVHLFRLEHEAVLGPTLRERPRYREPQLEHGPDYETYVPEGEPWFGF